MVFARSLAGDDPVNRLWTLDLATGIETMVVDPVALLADGGEMTEAEKARRERAREAGGGIVTYVLNRAGDAAVFALNGRVFRADLVTHETIELPATGSAYDPRPDPTDATVAFVSGSELYITESGGSPQRVSPEDPDASWGSAEFVAAEEMGRGRGYWWSPDGTRVLAARVDVSEVPVWWISNPTQPWDAPRPNRYPAAGTTNATVDLSILDLTGARLDIDWRRGEFEYLAKASWSARRRPTLVVQTRDQRTLAVLQVDPDSGHVTEVHRQTDPTWVELVPGLPSWSGERLITTIGDNNTVKLAIDGEAIGPDGWQIRSLITATREHALVTCAPSPTELHVARIPFDGSECELLTTAAGVHRASTGGGTVVISSADMSTFGTTTIVHPVPATVKAATTVAPGSTESNHALASHSEQPTVEPNVAFIEAGDTNIRTAVLLPHGHDGSPLPVLMDPYGGPHAQRVQRARNLYLTSQWFADQGFAVVVADGRGTPSRGPEFEQAVYGDLAAPVLADQITALNAAAVEFPLDLTRVAIRGWSFGGYLAALAVLREPEIFHAAIAGAPVTDWRLYDTHYTERYLGHPETDANNYANNDLCAEAHKLTRPLLLIHGLADDNVVAAHTLAFSRSLLEAGRPHQVLPLSGVTHMTPQEAVAENLLKLQLSFIRESLGS